MRDNFEMEKIINKWKAVARKRQIALAKDDFLNCEPFCTQSYTNPEQRKMNLKRLWTLLTSLTRQLLP